QGARSSRKPGAQSSRNKGAASSESAWICDLLLDNCGVYVQPINYPTVPKKTERLRIAPTPLHSDANIEHLVDALHALWSRCALARHVA
ncbi:aminotransferase class I/II-fold pyridoxal phosphate-dependent enzyme, partial [Rhizobium favelukesii]